MRGDLKLIHNARRKTAADEDGGEFNDFERLELPSVVARPLVVQHDQVVIGLRCLIIR